MSQFRKLRNKVVRKNREIQELEGNLQELEVKIREAKAYVRGLEESLKHVSSEEINKEPGSSLRPGGSIAHVHDILSQSGNPMYIKDILTEMGRNTDTDSQKALTSQLNNYVRQDRIFSRPVPNTFGLKVWGNTPPPDDEEGAQTAMAIN